MFKWIGAEHEEEITAYYLGYLVEEVTKFINEKNIKNETKQKRKSSLRK